MNEAINFTLGVSNRALQTGLDTAKGQLSDFKNQAAGILTGLFAGVTLDALIEDFARVQDLADQFNTSAESIQRVRGAADTAGTGIEFVAKQMAKLNIEVRKSAEGATSLDTLGSGSGNVGRAFEKLNINVANFLRLPMEEQLLAIAQGMDALPDEGQRIAAAYDLFGAKGKEIIPLLLQGHQALQEEFAKTAVASNAMVRKIADADDALARMQNTVKVGAASAFSTIFDWVEKLAQAFGGLQVIGGGFFEGLGAGFGRLKEGDFTGAAKAFKDSWNGSIDDVREAMGMLDFQREKEAEASRKKGAGVILDDADLKGAADKRTDLDTRMAELEEEQARKRLDIEQQILDLKQKQEDLRVRAAAERDDKQKGTLEDQVVATQKEINTLEDQREKNKIAAEKEIAQQKRKDRDDEDKHQERIRSLKDKLHDQEIDRMGKEEGIAALMKDLANLSSKGAQNEEEKLKMQIEANEIAGNILKRQDAMGFNLRPDAVRDIGGSLAGVDYRLMNQEAKTQTDLQKQIAGYLREIAGKEYKVEIPDAKTS